MVTVIFVLRLSFCSILHFRKYSKFGRHWLSSKKNRFQNGNGINEMRAAGSLRSFSISFEIWFFLLLFQKQPSFKAEMRGKRRRAGMIYSLKTDSDNAFEGGKRGRQTRKNFYETFGNF